MLIVIFNLIYHAPKLAANCGVSPTFSNATQRNPSKTKGK